MLIKINLNTEQLNGHSNIDYLKIFCLFLLVFVLLKFNGAMGRAGLAEKSGGPTGSHGPQFLYIYINLANYFLLFLYIKK